MEISRLLPSRPIKNMNQRFVANTDGLVYENIFTATTNATVFGNGTTTLDIAKTAGAVTTWDAQVYSTNGWVAPVTLEFIKPHPAVDSGGNYTMISLNTDPTTNADYGTLDYAIYPYSSTPQIYNNGTPISPGGTFLGTEKYYIVYKKNGFIQIFNGFQLIYQADTGSSTALRYFDTSMYNYGNAVHRIRVIRREWNGYAYI